MPGPASVAGALSVRLSTPFRDLYPRHDCQASADSRYSATIATDACVVPVPCDQENSVHACRTV